MLQVTVSSDDVAAFQPVVTVADAAFNGAGLRPRRHGRPGRRGRPRPRTCAPPAGPTTYLVRVASAAESSDGGAPTVVVTLGGRDVTPPAISVALPNDVPAPGDSRQYDASGSSDNGSGLDWNRSSWTFHDGPGRVRTVPGGADGQPVRATYRWMRPGLHRVDFDIADLAGNRAAYRFFVFVHDFQPPRITGFGVKSVPFPGRALAHDHAAPRGTRAGPRAGGAGNAPAVRAHHDLLRQGRRDAAHPPHGRRRAHAEPDPHRLGQRRGGQRRALPTCALDPVGGGGRCYPR